jgi:hypothetical protein
MSMASRIFVLSPARLDGERGKLLLNPRAQFPLARALREGVGAPIGDVFSFLSGLYFRGKRTYAEAFGRAPAGTSAIQVITTHRGLLSPDTIVSRRDLEAFASVDLGVDDPAFREPFLRDARALAVGLDPEANVVLLGSIATGKYVDPLLSVFGDRLLFPESFVGRGDMSRGGLLLRAVRANEELAYAPVAGSERHGRRPPKLVRIK